jgi:hypothetical protein
LIINLTPSWTLSTEHAASSYGIPVLVNCTTGEAFGPLNLVNAYPSWGLTPARETVTRMAKMATLSEEGTELVERFLATPISAKLHIKKEHRL